MLTCANAHIHLNPCSLYLENHQNQCMILFSMAALQMSHLLSCQRHVTHLNTIHLVKFFSWMKILRNQNSDSAALLMHAYHQIWVGLSPIICGMIKKLILGVWSCDVESACAGRYDDVYKMFMNEPNDVTPLRKRREAEEPKIEEGLFMIFSVTDCKK